MAQTSSEVRVYGDGAVYLAPVGTAFPASPLTAPAVAWVDLGFITPAGPRFDFGVDSANVMAWQALLAIRTMVTGRPAKVSFDLLQQSRANFELAFGGGTTTVASAGPPAIYKWVPPSGSDTFERALLVRGIDGTYVHDFGFAKVSNVGGIQFAYTKDNATALQIECTILDPGSGDPYQHLTNDPAFV